MAKEDPLSKSTLHTPEREREKEREKGRETLDTPHGQDLVDLPQIACMELAMECYIVEEHPSSSPMSF